MKLKDLLLEGSIGESLSPVDIYDFYFLWNIVTRSPSIANNDYASHVINQRIYGLKQKYLSIFKKLLVNQLLKYASRPDRIEPGFDKSKASLNSSFDELDKQMKLTKRSDRAIKQGAPRENTAWIQIAEFLENLSKASDRKNVFTYIDRINNSIHNTQTTIMDKFINAAEIIKALEVASKATNIHGLEKLTSKDVRDLAELGGGGLIEEAKDYEGTDSPEGANLIRRLHAKNLDAFTQGYVEAALFSSTDNLTPSGGAPLDKKYTIYDICGQTLMKMSMDCEDFQKKYRELYEQGDWSDIEAGRDFWFTRNSHGTGFWDRGYKNPKKEKIGKQLTHAAKSYGEYNLYLGDGAYDGLICGG
jgi:hypothetical protein